MSTDVRYDLDKLTVVHYPDPRLRQRCAPVTKFGPELAALTRRMLELMAESNGVGLAAPQVGLLLRLFVMNPTGEEQDARVVINPEIHDRKGNVAAEEGCLSLPGINVNVHRARSCRLVAQDVDGNRIELEGEDLVARIWQHETDHLDGVLIIDRMGPSDRIATRKTLRQLEQSHRGSR